MTQIYLIRHGQTQWNKEQIFRGTTEVPLDDVGRHQARLVAEALKDKMIRTIYSSPQSRAKETAEIIARPHGLDVKTLDGLKDLCFGEWQGISYQVVGQKYPDLYRRWLEAPDSVEFPGGESLRALMTRAVEAVKAIALNHPDDAVIVVAHRAVNRVLVCGLAGIDISRFWQIGQDTGAINLLEWKKGRFILTRLNDTCHMRPLGTEKTEVDR